MISTEPGKARLTSTCHGVSCSDLIGFHLGHDEGAVTLTGNRAIDQFLGTAFTVIPRRVNQSHPERKRPVRNDSSSSAARCLPCPTCPEALTDRRDNNAVAKLDGPRCAACGADGSRAASRANAPDKVTDEPSATQRSLNSRRLSNLVSQLLFYDNVSSDCVLDLKIDPAEFHSG